MKKVFMSTFGKISNYVALSLAISGLLLSGCSGQQGSDSSSEETTTQEDQGNQQQQEAPKFKQQQSAGSDSVTDQQLKKFTGAMDTNRSIRESMRPEMEKAVKDAGLSMREFQDISRKQQGGGRGMQGNQQDSDISQSKLKKFNQAKSNLKPIRKKMRQEMKKAIENQGMSMQEYQRILRKIRQDRSLQKRMRQMQSQGKKQPAKPSN
jgi:hypothetical protein